MADQQADVAAEAEANKRFSKGVKLRPEFFAKLTKVAANKKRPPGELIEEYMKQHIAAEHFLVLQDEAARAAAALAAARTSVTSGSGGETNRRVG